MAEEVQLDIAPPVPSSERSRRLGDNMLDSVIIRDPDGNIIHAPEIRDGEGKIIQQRVELNSQP